MCRTKNFLYCPSICCYIFSQDKHTIIDIFLLSNINIIFNHHGYKIQYTSDKNIQQNVYYPLYINRESL